jgi:hypothetical protein
LIITRILEKAYYYSRIGKEGEAMPKDRIVLPKIDYSEVDNRIQKLREREVLESIALQQIEAGSLQEKILAIESLGCIQDLLPHTLLELIRLRDSFENMDGMEEVVAAINHNHPGHHC